MRRIIERPLFAVPALLASLAVVGGVVSSSYYFSDDFLNFARARELPFRRWLNSELFGHWLPARKALDWGIDSWPLSWAVAVVLLLLFVGVTALLTRLVVLRLTGSAFWANIALVVLPLTATVPGTVQWWAGAAQVVPATTCAMLAAVAVLWLATTRGWRRLVPLALIGAALGLGLLFDERTAVIAGLAPLFLPLVVRGRTMWRAGVFAYAVMAPVLAGWYVLQSRYTDSESGVAPPLTILTFLVKALVQNAAPALVGWVTRPALSEDLLWVVGAVVLVLLVIGVVRARRPRRAAWFAGVWLAAVVLNTAPAAIVRAEEFGVSAALEPRYMTMAMPFGVIAAVGILSLQPAPSPRLRIVTAGLAGVAAIALVANLVNLHGRTAGRETGEWASDVRAAAAAAGVTTFYSSPVPGFVVPDAFYPYNLSSVVLPQILPAASSTVTTSEAGLVRADGTVEVVTPEPLGTAVLTASTGYWQSPGPDGSTCYTSLQTGARLTYALPEGDLDGGVVVIDVTGTFPTAGLRAATGPSADELRNKTASVGNGPPVVGADRWVTVDELPDADVLAIDADTGDGFCVADVSVGQLPRTW